MINRSRWVRAPAGLVAAIAIATLAGPVPVIAELAISRWHESITLEEIAQGISVFGMALLMTILICITIGLSLWIILHLLQWESLRAYVASGAFAGCCLPAIVFYPWNNMNFQTFVVIAWLSFVGAAASGAFWLVVFGRNASSRNGRLPRRHQPQ